MPTPHIGGRLHDDQGRRVRDISVGHPEQSILWRTAFKVAVRKMPFGQQIDFLAGTGVECEMLTDRNEPTRRSKEPSNSDRAQDLRNV